MRKLSSWGACTSILVIFVSLVSAQQQSSSSPAPQAPLQHRASGVLPSPQPTETLTTERRLEVLEEQMNTTIALKQAEIDNLKDRLDFVYKIVGLAGALGAFLILFLTIQDSIHRSKEGTRQRGIDDLVKEMMRLQNAAMTQQNSLSAIQVGAAESDPARHLERVQNVNQVIDTVQKTLAFRLEQERKVADVIKTIEKQEAERERKDKQKLEAATSILEGFKNVNRMQFSTLTTEQQKRAIKLVEKVTGLDDSLSEKDFEVAGSLLYTCGAITYYDEDIIQARSFFDQAAQCRAKDHTGELSTNKSYRKRFAFIHYFRAIIQKNWGELSEALHEIEQSDKLLKDDNTEFLTPTTKAEILSCIEGDEQRCRTEALALLDRITALEKSKSERGETLNQNQLRLRNRLWVLLGNTHFVAKDYHGALEQYESALNCNPNDYYALASAAQCHRALGAAATAQDVSKACLSAIERSDDFARKRERITRAVIAVLAANSARACGDTVRYSTWARNAHELLEGNLAVDGLSPKFFSPSSKRLVSSTELLKEVEEPPLEAVPPRAA